MKRFLLNFPLWRTVIIIIMIIIIVLVVGKRQHHHPLDINIRDVKRRWTSKCARHHITRVRILMADNNKFAPNNILLKWRRDEIDLVGQYIQILQKPSLIRNQSFPDRFLHLPMTDVEHLHFFRPKKPQQTNIS